MVVVLVHAAVKKLKTETLLVLAVLETSTFAVMKKNDAVIEVDLTLAAMVAMLVQNVVPVVRVAVQAVFKQTKSTTLVVPNASAVGGVSVKVDTRPVVAVGLMLAISRSSCEGLVLAPPRLGAWATTVAVSITREMQVAGVVVNSAVYVLKTKTRQVVALLEVVGAEVTMSKHVVVVVGMMRTSTTAVVVMMEVRAVGVVMHAVAKVVKT